MVENGIWLEVGKMNGNVVKWGESMNVNTYTKEESKNMY